MANRPSFMQDFINLYRKHKCLWKIKDSTYANRALRTKAYEELLDLYKTVDVEATLESVKNKINNMRSAFRKELKKVKLSKKSGTSPDETYTPSLWYYDSLLFTADQEECRETFSSSMDMQDESEKVDNEENEVNGFVLETGWENFLVSGSEIAAEDERSPLNDITAKNNNDYSSHENHMLEKENDQTNIDEGAPLKHITVEENKSYLGQEKYMPEMDKDQIHIENHVTPEKPLEQLSTVTEDSNILLHHITPEKKNTKDSDKICSQQNIENRISTVLPGVIVPSPFKNSMFWPNPSTSKKIKRKMNVKVPSVGTSDAWREYHLKKEEAKAKAETAKNENKRKREETKKIKEYTLCTTPRFLTECQQINRTNDIQCIVLEDELSCIERVDGGGATFASVSAEGAFLGAGKINLLKLATFQLETESNPYDYQTAIVTNQNIPDGLSGLRNISYCHPGFDTTDVNLLLLIEFERQVLLENSIDICSNDTAPLVEKHIRAIHDFFGPSCRPGRWVQDTEFDTILKQRYPRLSALCNSSAYQTNSGRAFTQALDCALNTNKPAVALTTVSTITTQRQNDNFVAFTICRNGTISDTSISSCEWSTIPNRVVIANKNSYDQLPAELEIWFSNSLVATELSATLTDLTLTQIDLIRTVLFPDPNVDYKISVQHLELSLHEYTSAFRQNLTVQRSRQCATEMRWCTISDNEQRKCEAWSRAGLHNGIQPVLSCIQAQSRRECISFIDKNDADAVTIGADFGYFAKLAGLEAIAFPETEQEYLIHTLLIVRPTITRRESLRTRRGCFNRYGSAAWLSFINATKSIILNSNKCEYGELLNDALGSSCMPGAGSLNLPNLCSLCKANGTGEHTCATNSTNLYAGNQGALDCLRDVGDFAVITKTDGLVLPENVTVMCRNGTLAHNMGLDVDNNCYLTIITTDEIVTRRNDPKNLDIQLMLRESDRRFATDPRSPFKLFGTFDSIPNLLFRDSTPGLDLPNSQNVWIRNYQALFRHIDSCKAGSSTIQMPSLIILTIISLVLTWYIK
ncbi:transferrin [Holotrichia oblita]|uniref:Transferrin n=1 Tax=Holotrichia oblita TaxID=644536 RepID=A0ACB9SYG8_HOLOL|nr:transferrin [Holotrichia oblita]